MGRNVSSHIRRRRRALSLSSKKDKAVAKAEAKAKRQKKKSGKPTEGPYIDPVGEARTYHNAGKGDKIRDISGWFSDDVTNTLEKIYGKKDWKKKTKQKNSSKKTR